MHGTIRPSVRPAGSLTVEAYDALRALDASHDAPMLLGYHPVARLNPFQALLYAEAWDAGIAPIPVIAEEAIDELAELTGVGRPTVLHLHWLNHPRRDAASAADAQADADGFIARLDRFLARGGRIAWTVHNVLPHDSPFGDIEARVHQAVADRASVIHVLAERTADHVAPFYRLPPERILHVPHPSYDGAYADLAGRGQARHDLGLDPDELVFLVTGAIRPYKGIDRLLDAWQSLPPGVRRLVIAGEPRDDAPTARLLERAVLDPTVLVHARRIPAEQMQLFLRAADVVVLPYLRSLNSGALMLALTFGVPVMVPADGALAEAVDPSYALTWDQDDTGSLREALARAASLATPEARAAARAAAEARDPRALSRRFAAALRERIPASDAPAPRAPDAAGATGGSSC